MLGVLILLILDQPSAPKSTTRTRNTGVPARESPPTSRLNNMPMEVSLSIQIDFANFVGGILTTAGGSPSYSSNNSRTSSCLARCDA